VTTFIPTTPPETDPAQDSVPNLPFWPSLSLAAFREGYRVDTVVTAAEARQAIATAARRVNAELADWQALQAAAGYATLADVEAPLYGEQSEHVANYLGAVYHRAKALVIQDYRDTDTTKSGHDRADDMTGQADIAMARSRSAVRAILGQPRATVELI
jgi:hypothetical protein